METRTRTTSQKNEDGSTSVWAFDEVEKVMVGGKPAWVTSNVKFRRVER